MNEKKMHMVVWTDSCGDNHVATPMILSSLDKAKAKTKELERIDEIRGYHAPYHIYELKEVNF